MDAGAPAADACEAVMDKISVLNNLICGFISKVLNKH
jgi:hypothetical protein